MQRKVLRVLTRRYRAGVTSVVRAVEVPSLYSTDYTYQAAKLLLWTAAELATTIIAASIPVLRALLRNIVNSSYRNRGRSGTHYSGNFKSTNYGNSRSRSDSFQRTGSVAMCTSAPQRQKSPGALANIYEQGESATSLIMQSPHTSSEGKDFGMEHGGILKTEVITVNYDARSQTSNTASNGTDTMHEIELQQVSPTYGRGKSL